MSEFYKLRIYEGLWANAKIYAFRLPKKPTLLEIEMLVLRKFIPIFIRDLVFDPTEILSIEHTNIKGCWPMFKIFYIRKDDYDDKEQATASYYWEIEPIPFTVVPQREEMAELLTNKYSGIRNQAAKCLKKLENLD